MPLFARVHAQDPRATGDGAARFDLLDWPDEAIPRLRAAFARISGAR